MTRRAETNDCHSKAIDSGRKRHEPLRRSHAHAVHRRVEILEPACRLVADRLLARVTQSRLAVILAAIRLPPQWEWYKDEIGGDTGHHGSTLADHGRPWIRWSTVETRNRAGQHPAQAK